MHYLKLSDAHSNPTRRSIPSDYTATTSDHDLAEHPTASAVRQGERRSSRGSQDSKLQVCLKKCFIGVPYLCTHSNTEVYECTLHIFSAPLGCSGRDGCSRRKILHKEFWPRLMPPSKCIKNASHDNLKACFKIYTES